MFLIISKGEKNRILSSSHPVDIRDQSSFFRCVDPLVVGPHTTLDGEQQHLEVSLLLEPGREQVTQKDARKLYIYCSYVIVWHPLI